MRLTDLSDTQQNYIEAIFLLSKDNMDGVRLIDIANKLNVRPPSALEVISRLKDMGLLLQERHNKIKLTNEGKKLGEQVSARHKTIRAFLTDVLRVPENIAEKDACKVEHALGTVAYNRLCDFIEHIHNDKIEYDDAIPVTMMNRGESGIVKRITGGAGKIHRLSSLGVRIGAKVTVLQNNRHAPILLKVGDASGNIGIGRGMATCIHVIPNCTVSEN